MQQGTGIDPIVVELPKPTSPIDIFWKLQHLPKCIFLDSALRHETLGRYSFVAADPFDFLEIPSDSPDSFLQLQTHVARFHHPSIGELPPFQGGAAGLLSYDLARSVESIPQPEFSEFRVPAVAIGLYDVVVAFDHFQEKAWLISHGFPELDLDARKIRAYQRARYFENYLQQPVPKANRETSKKLALTGPTFSVSGMEKLVSNFDQRSYWQAIEHAIEYVYSGDIFQVNLAQRLAYPATSNSAELYLRLRERNPATFAGFFDLGESQLVSASPERFLRVKDRQVEARPIKGTRPRTLQPEADLFAGSELKASEKDIAENVMIVDLMRNDLSRSCTPESIHVTQLCAVEVYEFVQHLVSSVTGELEPGHSVVDLIRCAFPGGSITGAPKFRAMEIIAELEPHARDAYCGSLGYIGFDGSCDLSILIRTITCGNGWWRFPVGGGIVAQSSPKLEYEETWHKAEGMLRALT